MKNNRTKIGRPLALDNDQIDYVISAYASGASTVAIGKVFGVSHTTIRRALLSNGVHLRNSNNLPPMTRGIAA